MSQEIQSSYSAVNGPDQSPRISKRVVWISAVVLAVLMLGMIGTIVWLAFSFPDRIEAMRDVFIMLFSSCEWSYNKSQSVTPVRKGYWQTCVGKCCCCWCCHCYVCFALVSAGNGGAPNCRVSPRGECVESRHV